MSEREDESSEVQKAEDALYMHLDRYGADKKLTYLISALIDAKLAEMLRGQGNAWTPQKQNESLTQDTSKA